MKIIPSLTLISWVAFCLWILVVFEGESLLLQYAMISGFWVFPGAFAWMGYSAQLAVRLLPQVDPIVYPTAFGTGRRVHDSFFFRMHRLLMYSASASSLWLNSRLLREFDFSHLPAELQRPLKIHFYWLCALNIFMFSSFAAIKLWE